MDLLYLLLPSIYDIKNPHMINVIQIVDLEVIIYSNQFAFSNWNGVSFNGDGNLWGNIYWKLIFFLFQSYSFYVINLMLTLFKGSLHYTKYKYNISLPSSSSSSSSARVWWWVYCRSFCYSSLLYACPHLLCAVLYCTGKRVY